MNPIYGVQPKTTGTPTASADAQRASAIAATESTVSAVGQELINNTTSTLGELMAMSVPGFERRIRMEIEAKVRAELMPSKGPAPATKEFEEREARMKTEISALSAERDAAKAEAAALKKELASLQSQNEQNFTNGNAWHKRATEAEAQLAALRIAQQSESTTTHSSLSSLMSTTSSHGSSTHSAASSYGSSAASKASSPAAATAVASTDKNQKTQDPVPKPISTNTAAASTAAAASATPNVGAPVGANHLYGDPNVSKFVPGRRDEDDTKIDL